MTTATELVARLRRHYIKDDLRPGGVFMSEVCPAMGGPRLDALYVGFVASRSPGLDGHEVKVSRSDWRAELDAPEKAEWWASRCHRWWIVAPDTKIVRAEELPDGWGLIVPLAGSRTRMQVVVKAARREPTIDWPLLFGLLKKADTLRFDAVFEARGKADAAAAARYEAALFEARGRAAVADPWPGQVLDTLERALGQPIARFTPAGDDAKGISVRAVADALRAVGPDLRDFEAVGRMIEQAIARFASLEQLGASVQRVGRDGQTMMKRLRTLPGGQG